MFWTKKEVAPPILQKIDAFRGPYYFLSNFYPAYVELDYARYTSVENAYQAAKTLNIEAREPLQWHGNLSAAQAKMLGQSLTLREDWETVKDGIMLDLLRQKFDLPEFKTLLLATGDAELIEGNWWGDTYWGVCNGKGENKLGKLLMQIREEAKKNG